MKRFLSILSFVSCFLFLVCLTSFNPSLADDTIGGLQISTESPITYPNDGTITVKGLPNSGDFLVNVYGFNQTCDAGTILSAQIAFSMKDDGSCDQIRKNGFGDYSCSNGTFTGKVHSSEFGLDTQDPGEFSFAACSGRLGENFSSNTNFTVQVGDISTAATKVDFIFNTDGSTNSPTAPTKPGEQIGIRLAGAKNQKYYVFIQAGSDPQTTTCDNPTCTLYATIPADIKSSSITLIITGEDGGNLPSTVVYLSSSALPTPTKLPPPPPCKIDLKTSNSGCTSIYSAIGPLNTDSFKFIGQLFAVLLSISGGIALLLIIRSGYQLMTSQGNPEKVKEARERLTSVFVGLLFLVLSVVILEVIGVDLLSLPGLSK